MILDATATTGNTEERIKNAARIVFLEKGLDGARTQEIANLAEVNHSLIPYYFKSKQKLFDVVLVEALNAFVGRVDKIVNDGLTDFETKVYRLVDCYSEMVIESPHLPLYSITIMRKRNSKVLNFTKQMRNMLYLSVMARQLKQEVEDGKFKPTTIAHVLMNLMGLTIFPALAAPILKTMGDIKEEPYKQLIESRRKHIADWVLYTLR
jgi:AcrR family transcriptional regulator